MLVNITSNQKLKFNTKLYTEVSSSDFKIILVRCNPNGNEFYIRMADNLNLMVNYDENNNICIGELEFLIPNNKKSWILNQDKTISPKNDP